MFSKNTLKTAGQCLVGLGLLYYILSQLSLNTIVHNLRALNWKALLLVLLLKFVMRFLSAYKWYVLLSIQHTSAAFRRVLASHFIGGAVGVIIPFVGADITMGYSYYKYSGQAGNSISSLLVDRIIGAYITIFTGVLGVLLSLDRFIEIQPILFLSGGLLLAAAGSTSLIIYLIRNPKSVASLPILSRWKGLINEIRVIISDYLKQWRTSLTLNIVLSFVMQGLRILATYALAIAVQANVSIMDFVAIVPLIFLIIMIPISISGLGLQEGAFIFLFGLVGVSAESAFAMSIIGRSLSLISVLPGALWAMLGGLYTKECEKSNEFKTTKETEFMQ